MCDHYVFFILLQLLIFISEIFIHGNCIYIISSTHSPCSNSFCVSNVPSQYYELFFTYHCYAYIYVYEYNLLSAFSVLCISFRQLDRSGVPSPY